MATKAEREQDTHSRWATVLDGELKDWVVVAVGTPEEFEAGVVGGHRIDADQHCTRDCPGRH